MISERLKGLVALALAEDVGHGDATSLATISADATATGRIVARSPLVVSGIEAAEAVFKAVDPECVFTVMAGDGQSIAADAVIATVSGRARALLTAERTALNFLQHLSGIATMTARYVAEISGTGARIVDTRKTVPGLRDLAKAAVRHGGGRNHRVALDDGILIKDNHVVTAGGIARAILSARSNGGYLLRVEVECDTLQQVSDAIDAGADMILLDNMAPDALRAAVTLCRRRAQTEASGGVSLSTVRSIAETGVDFISVGALTHSAPAADIALDFDAEARGTP
ncbi:MAG TPA: carboxylating nicotinate-nucleotide diphosphorylase [Armatimonadota bacterium]